MYVQVISEALNAIAPERLQINLLLFTIRRRRIALFKKSIARRSSFDFERLTLLRVNSGYNRAARGQLFLMYKIERSSPPLSILYLREWIQHQ